MDSEEVTESNDRRCTTVYVYTSPRTAVLNGVQHGWHGVDVGLQDLSQEQRERLAGLVDDQARLHYGGQPVDLADASLAGLRQKLSDMIIQEGAERAARTEAQREKERLAGCLQKENQVTLRAERGTWLHSLGFADDGEIPLDLLRKVAIKEMVKALGALGEGWTSIEGDVGFSQQPPSYLTPEQSAVVEAHLGRDYHNQVCFDKTRELDFVGLPAAVNLRVTMVRIGQQLDSTPCILAKMQWQGQTWLVMKAL